MYYSSSARSKCSRKREYQINDLQFSVISHKNDYLVIWIIVVIRQQKEHKFYGILLLHMAKTMSRKFLLKKKLN